MACSEPSILMKVERVSKRVLLIVRKGRQGTGNQGLSKDWHLTQPTFHPSTDWQPNGHEQALWPRHSKQVLQLLLLHYETCVSRVSTGPKIETVGRLYSLLISQRAMKTCTFNRPSIKVNRGARSARGIEIQSVHVTQRKQFLAISFKKWCHFGYCTLRRQAFLLCTARKFQIGA